MERMFKGRHRVTHRYAWLWEDLEMDPGFELRPMFGGKAAYFDGRLHLYFAAKEEPWRGVLVATGQERHAALLAEFPTLHTHPVLSKWLYLPESEEEFERLAQRLIALARARDPRLGVDAKPKKRKRREQIR